MESEYETVDCCLCQTAFSVVGTARETYHFKDQLYESIQPSFSEEFHLYYNQIAD